MRYILPLLFLSAAVFAQNDCAQSVDSKAKRSFKKAKSAAKEWNYGKAYAALSEALSIQEDYAEALYLFGQLKLEEKAYAEAQDYLKKGIAICPMYSSEIYWLIASMAYEAKDFQEAAFYYDSYLRFMNISEENRVLAQERWARALFLDEMYANPVPYDPKPVKGISTPDDEYLPILSPDNDIALFTRRRAKQEVGMLRSETVEELVVSSLKNDLFQWGDIMPKPFNLYDNEGGASLTIDNNELYLTVCEPLRGYNNCDIYYSRRVDSLWSELKPLRYPVNKSDSWESQPTISSDGNTLYFASARADGKGGSDIYSVEKQEDGRWGNMQPFPWNTSGDEKSPFLHPDNQTLYFSSNSLQGMGGMDIYYVKKDTTGAWGEPQNIGYPINSELDELGFFVSTDGKTAYFASNKLEGVGGWDVYSFPLYKEARPARVLLLKGDVLDDEGESIPFSEVELRSMKTNQVRTVDVDMNTGRYVTAITLDADEDLLVTVKGDGFAFNSEYVAADDKSFARPQQLDFELKVLQKGEAFKINNIQFETDSFALNKQARFVLTSFAEFLALNESIKVAIHGHTDSMGEAAENLLLSTKRAKSVHDFLIAEGVSSVRLSYAGFGEQQPLQSNEQEQGRAENRRTEFFVVER